jgi:endonuclease/exonuclease/phosphatase family metal-dependent hydrolase
MTGTPMRLRVVTLNIWNEQGDPGRLKLINQELRDLGPDLVAFQEVVHDDEHSQMDAMLGGTGLHATHQAQTTAVTPPYAADYGGTALATRWPHRVVEVADLRMSDAMDVPWFAVAALVPLPVLGEVLFIGTATSWRLSAESARERQAVALADLDARHRTELPTIIAGDFNASPDAASIRFLTGRQSLGGRSVCYHDAWAIAGDGPGHTWSVDNPNARLEIDNVVRQPEHRRRVDYVLIGSWDAHPTTYCRVNMVNLAFNRPSGEIWPSDHFGVLADLDIGRTPTE